MARTLEQRLALLRKEPKSTDVADALGATIGYLVAAAAPLADAHGLVDELVPAFERLTVQPIKRDPGCRGKVAIARTLHDLERWESAVFVAGVTLVQAEPAYGGAVDTAAELRGICGIAHAHFGRDDALDVLARLLADPERTARIAAASGLGDAGRHDASALLRYKLLVGDTDPEVLAAAFEALFTLTREHAIEFVAAFLDGDDDRASLAAFALGTSRLPEAYPLLARWCESCLPRQRGEVGYLALALMRHEPATAQLLAVISGGDPDDAIAAATALATFKDDPAMRERLAEAARAQLDAAAREAIAKL